MTEFSKKTLENKDRFLKNGVTNIETVGHNGTHMNFPNYSTKFYTLEYISQQSIIKLNSQNNKFLKISYGAEGKYFCHYLGPSFIKLRYGLDFNYDTASLSSIKCMKTCKISFYHISYHCVPKDNTLLGNSGTIPALRSARQRP